MKNQQQVATFARLTTVFVGAIVACTITLLFAGCELENGLDHSPTWKGDVGFKVDASAAPDAQAPAKVPCIFADKCVTAAFLHDGECVVEHVMNCDDGNSCTYDVCDDGVCQHYVSNSGCSKCKVNADCDDKDACTYDQCNQGECQHFSEVATPEHPTVCYGECKVDADCTNAPSAGCGGFCTPSKVCYYPQAGHCDDGNACTLDVCCHGVCSYHPQGSCDDKDACTADWCDPKTGACVHAKIPGCGGGLEEEGSPLAH